MESLKFLDLFAGVGGFRLGMEKAGHECVGHVEWDKFARKSYEAIFETEGDYTENDIRAVRADELPRANVWCFGFPCQDISIAGSQEGFDGERSSLFYAVTRLIRDLKKENKPEYLFIENVKNLLSVNRGFDFLRLQIELDEIGYNVEWDVLNSKHFGVPQNRERIFVVGHLRTASTRKIFPFRGEEESVDIEQPKIVEVMKMKENRHSSLANSVLDTCGISPTLDTMNGGGREPKIIIKGNTNPSGGGMNGNVFEHSGLSPTLTTNKGEEQAVIADNFRIRKLTPRECWRLQGFPDWAFDKAATVNSNSQLYKQAGNSVTVPVIYEIAKRLEVYA